jgi:hypothetical protein
VDDVTGTAPGTSAGEVAVGLQFAQDALTGAFSDPGALGGVTDPPVGGVGDGSQDAGVVGQERPGLGAGIQGCGLTIGDSQVSRFRVTEASSGDAAGGDLPTVPSTLWVKAPA